MKFQRVLMLAGGLLFPLLVSAAPELSMNGYKIGDTFKATEAKAEKECSRFSVYFEDSRSAELTKQIYQGDSSIWSCMTPIKDSIPAQRILFEFIDGKIATIFADIEPGREQEASSWLLAKFGGPTEISNAYAAHDVHMHRIYSETFAYYGKREGLMRTRINGRKETRTFVYVMDGVSQKISPLNSSYFR
ncbi:hypothetical protein ACUUMB_15080 [Enterobacter kobei]